MCQHTRWLKVTARKIDQLSADHLEFPDASDGHQSDQEGDQFADASEPEEAGEYFWPAVQQAEEDEEQRMPGEALQYAAPCEEGQNAEDWEEPDEAEQYVEEFYGAPTRAEGKSCNPLGLEDADASRRGTRSSWELQEFAPPNPILSVLRRLALDLT